MEQKVSLKLIGKYNGHSVKANKSVDLSFKTEYDQLVETIKLLQLLNNDISIKAKASGESPCQLGTFRVQAVNVMHDGSSTIKFNSMTDFTEVDNFNKLVGSELTVLKIDGVVELENESEE